MALLCSDHPDSEGGGGVGEPTFSLLPGTPHAVWPFLWEGARMGRNHSSGQGSHQPAGHLGRLEVKYPSSWQTQPLARAWGLPQPEPPPAAAGPPQETRSVPTVALGRGREHRMEVGRGRGDKGCPEKGGHRCPPCPPTPTTLGWLSWRAGQKRGRWKGEKSPESERTRIPWEEGQVPSVLESVQMCQHNWADACTPAAWPGATRKPRVRAWSIGSRHVLADSCEQTELEQILSRDVHRVGGVPWQVLGCRQLPGPCSPGWGF